MADTFCPYPWKSLAIYPAGDAGICCKFKGRVCNGGTPLSVYSDSLDQIWNSDQLREVRRAMLEGRRVPGCEPCYQEEAASGQSLRTITTEAFRWGMWNPRRISVDELRARAAKEGDRLSSMPQVFWFGLGNLCNLKCRMCSGAFSTRIEGDPVHREWTSLPTAGEAGQGQGTARWFRTPGFVQEKILRDPSQLLVLNFAGGEPLITKEIGDILQFLVEEGVSQRVELQVNTNGTTADAPWLSLVQHFKHLQLAVSLDGFGELNEYIRFPSTWEKVMANLDVLRQLPNTRVIAAVTLQAYNALELVNLLRHLDAIELPFYVHLLHEPSHLRADVLPPKARREAARRLRSYGEKECLPENRDVILAYAAGLEAGGTDFDRELLRTFMLFTNDLDLTRQQSFAATHRQLMQLLADDGVVWTPETVHAARGMSRLSSKI